MSWVLIRTEPRKELAVYTAILDLADDAWLPREPRFTRNARSRNQRQWWAPVLPGHFFAAGVRLADIATLRHFERIEADCHGRPIAIPEAVVMRFRRAIDDENREMVRLAGKRSENRRTAARNGVSPTERKVKRGLSRRLKPRKVAAQLRAEVSSRLARGIKGSP